MADLDALRPIIAITQARIGSQRLPGKVLKDLGGKPLLWWHLTRLARAKTIDGVIVATTLEPGAEQIASLAERLGLAVFRGDVADVLGRFAGAAQLMSAKTVVRVTSDCPLIDPVLIDHAVRSFAETALDCGYVALAVDHYPRGLDCEVFTADSLAEADLVATDAHDREHVTPFIRRDEQRRPRWLFPESPVPNQRWCVDTEEDLEFVRRVIEGLRGENPEFGWQDALALIEANQNWLQLNAYVSQK